MRICGIPGVEPLSVPTHLSAFYRSEKDLLSLVSTFIQAGLLQQEYCLWVTAPPLPRTEAFASIESVVPDLKHYISLGQLDIVSYEDWYLVEGQFEESALMQRWQKKVEQAALLGLRAIRITGNPSWLRTSAQWEHFLKYEERMHEWVSKNDVLALCTYPVEYCDTDQMLKVFQTHSHALYASGKERWTLMPLSTTP
jgi:hypothetical protein